MTTNPTLLQRIESRRPRNAREQYEYDEGLRDHLEIRHPVHVDPGLAAANESPQPPIDRFFRMVQRVFDSPQHNALSHAAQVLLAYMGRRYNGKSNCRIAIPISRLKALGFNKNSLSRAKIELEKAGFIVPTRRRIVRAPAQYALTWLLPADHSDFDAWIKVWPSPRHSRRRARRVGLDRLEPNSKSVMEATLESIDHRGALDLEDLGRNKDVGNEKC